jgi:hypothetical protein
MQRLHSGLVEQACEDVLACQRLARHCGHGPYLINHNVGNMLVRKGSEAVVALAHHGKLTADQARRIQDDISRLSAPPQLAIVIGESERLLYLDCIALLQRLGPRSARFLASDFGGTLLGADPLALSWREQWMKRLTDHAIDWDEALRVGNVYYDRVVVALRLTDHAQRIAALHEVEEELERVSIAVKNPVNQATILALDWGGKRKAAGRLIGGLMVCMTFPMFALAHDAEQKCAAVQPMSLLALALAAYRAERGEYPDTLSKLGERYISAVPKDPFSGGEFHYQRTGKGTGYALYSVGRNSKDDGGRNRIREIDDPDSDAPEGADDIAIRTP